MKGVLNRFKNVRVLVVGDLVADHYVYGQTERVSREAPVLIVRHEREEVKLGGAANVAANARALGAHVTAFGLLGRDAMGKALRALFAQQNIEVAAIAREPTETKTRVLAGGQSTSRQQMLRIDRGNTSSLSLNVSKKLEALLSLELERCDIVAVSDYGAGVLTPGVRSVLKQAAARGTKVCVDSRYALAQYQGFTVCKPNEPELAALTGLPLRNDDELEVATRRALEQLACETLVVTRGRRGMAVVPRVGPLTLIEPTGPREAVDVTGAGDTVSAAFALAFAAGASPLDAARIANVAGSLVVQKPGTATVSLAELKGSL